MSIGLWQLLLILLIILLLFGSGKLPKVMQDFAKGLKDMKATLAKDKEVDLEKDQASIKKDQDEKNS